MDKSVDFHVFLITYMHGLKDFRALKAIKITNVKYIYKGLGG